MQRFKQVFGNSNCKIIAMLHAPALPGSPKYDGNWTGIIDRILHETHIYIKHKVDAVLIENMHDVPYVQRHGPETVANMTRISCEVQRLLKPTKIPCGIQVLATGNREAIAICKSAELQFCRVEGFVFSHVADEGWTDACAGQLIRYRRSIDAENILVLTDVKKKHSSHSITDDVSLLDTVHAAEFFLSDGIVLTGTATGHPANTGDLNEIHGKTELPILIGSGVTRSNLKDYFGRSSGIIIGSHFKRDGKWQNELCEQRISEFMREVDKMRC